MFKSLKSGLSWGLGGILIIAALVYGFRTPPVEIDLATVTTGPLSVTVEEDGRTRVKERYIASSPLAGRLLRVELHSGDSVTAGETVVATIEASDPSLLDARARADAAARVNAAMAERDRVATRVEASRDALRIARNELDRVEELFGKKVATAEVYETAQLKFRLATHEQSAAEFGIKIAEFELEQARSALLRYGPRPDDQAELFRYLIRAPITGRVFRVFQDSSTIVTPGTRLIELGDPTDLEVEVDVLSVDAARIRPGATVHLRHWGGTQPLEARVRLVEPSAFTKISALGIEEQRVWIIADLVTPPEERPTLGDGFRVEAAIVVAELPKVVKIPSGCLFRDGEKWAVFVVRNDHAAMQAVTVGLTNGIETEIREGLSVRDMVILHPSDRIAAGVRVVPR